MIKRIILFFLGAVVCLSAFGQCPIKALADDLADPANSPDLLNYFINNNPQATLAHRAASKYPTVRVNTNSLDDLIYIFNSTALSNAGFDHIVMKKILDNMNPITFNMLSTANPNNGVEELISIIKSLESIPNNDGSLALVRSGLNTTNVASYNGEIFRLSQVRSISASNISDVEKTIPSPGAPYGQNNNRYADITTNSGINIECKYWGNVLEESPKAVKLAEQIHKDLLSIKNLINQGTPAGQAFNKFEFRFKQSSNITSEASLRNQLEGLFYNSQYNTQEITNIGQELHEVRDALNAINGLFGGSSPYSNLQDYFQNSPSIKFIP